MRQQRRNLVTTSAGIDPGTLANLELRLAGPSVAGSPEDQIALWADSSGKGRDASQATGANRPYISGGSVNNPNAVSGRRGIGFNVFAPSFMEGLLPGATIGSALGHTFYCWLYEYSFGGNNQVIWQDNTGGRPRLLYSSSTGKIGWADAFGTNETVAQTAGYHSLVYAFNPPNDGSGVCRVYRDNVLIGTSAWNYGFDVPTSYFLGANQVANAGLAATLYEFAFFSAAHSLATIQRVLEWGVGYWGF